MSQSATVSERPAVTVSERAAKRIAEIVAGEPNTPLLRVSVEGGGCSGFSYKFDLVPASEPGPTQRLVVCPISPERTNGYGSRLGGRDDESGGLKY